MLSELIEEFILNCRLKNYTSSTISTYSINLHLVENYLKLECGISEIESIEKKNLKEFICYQMEKGYKSSYINVILKIIRSFYNYLVEENYLSENIAKEVPFLKQEKMILHTYNNEEISKLTKYYDFSDFLNARNKLIILIFIDTGLRCFELRQMKMENVEDNYIRIKGKGNKWRVVPISLYLKKKMLRYERIRGKYVSKFTGRKIDNNYFVSRNGKELKSNVMIEKIVKEASIACGVRSMVRASPHTLRHYFAVQNLKQGQDLFTISKILGHTNVKITQTYLESISDDEIIEKALLTSPLMNLREII
ncbi:tyrosine-type recombinase/integrase [Carnobacterium gallinarum]|uniref:tyrosine-type recombinase/integrase n=1 Tax=Carnobacterium gallinarum TaxID=2749 RepID=UPI00054D7188|nr:tyrosine-type recombinase/integrase [Carnobacterium gallinarum]